MTLKRTPFILTKFNNLRFFKALSSLLFLFLIFSLSFSPVEGISKQSLYFPSKGDAWEKRKPEDLGMNSKLLQEAVEFARENPSKDPKDLKKAIERSFSREPFFSILGPTKERGETNGIVIKNGYIVAEWGDTKRVDMTFSVTKSYLSTVAGLALDAGLIGDVQEHVKKYVKDGKFDSEHNAKITWRHLLTQTSDWSGTLWDRQDWADRPPRDATWDKIRNRELNEPGTNFKYNDVRVNLLAYSLLQVWRLPLPVILREKIMDRIDASSTWRWHGYKNSWVLIDGVKVQSVSGGGHWGGGMFISTRDQARFGLLFLRKGNWRGKQLISQKWVRMIQVPTPVVPVYGYMWWLNTKKQRIPSAPESVYFAAGFGGNYIVVDNEHDLVIVVRWTGDLDGIIKRILDSIK
jgi:CubicO group peptidase (beta-lactamase class C family)